MPAKPRRKKGQRLSQEARRKAGAVQAPAAGHGAPGAAPPQSPVARPRAAAPSASVAMPARPAAVTYPYLGKELRTIIILGGIILAALIAVALFLR